MPTTSRSAGYGEGMREAFAHTAVLDLAAGADVRAPGGAITLGLCGAWEHDPPCPLAAHHTAAERDDGDGEVRLRVLFAAEPADEAAVRERIDAALRAGEVVGPDGVLSRWRLRDSRPGVVAAAETEHAGRLARG
jgi:hypothetical protein